MPETTTAPTDAARAAAGAAYLDEHEPGWWQHIDIERLELSSPCRCVLGQLETALYGDGPEDNAAFSDAVWRYGLLAEADRLGFDIGFGMPNEYGELTAAWRELILARREGGAR